jgi:hypothetical protein
MIISLRNIFFAEILARKPALRLHWFRSNHAMGKVIENAFKDLPRKNKPRPALSHHSQLARLNLVACQK